MLRNLISILVLGVTLAAGGQAWASIGSDITVNGFMSTGLSWTDTDKIIYNYSITENPTADKLTVFGLNFNGNLSDRLSFNAITVIRGREANPAMRLDTANISYQLTDTTRVRAGKIRAPIWLVADYLDVRALQPWARAPEEFYEAPFDVFAYDGVSLIQSFPLGGTYFELEAFGGAGRVAVREKRLEIDGDIRDFVGVSGRLIGSNWLFKASWSRADVKNYTYWDLTPEDVIDAYNDPAKNRRTQSINPTPMDVSNMQFANIGFKYDGAFFLMTEYGRVTSGNSVSKTVPNWNTSYPTLPKASFAEVNAFYVTPGFYFSDRDYLMHFTYAHVDDKEFVGIWDGGHHSWTVGLNRYFGDNLVVKAAWGQSAPTKYKEGKDGLFNGLAPDQPINVYDLSLNMTF